MDVREGQWPDDLAGRDLRIDPERLSLSLRVMHGRINAEALLRPLLDDVLDACNDLFSLSGCGLLLEDDEQALQFVAATDSNSRELEVAQCDIVEGPCVEAFVTGLSVESINLKADTRWPRLRQVTSLLPVHAILGCPVFLAGIPVGSLDVYLDAPHEWDDSERRAISRYSDVVGSILDAAMREQRASDLAEQLRHALESRVIIERSVGFLMASQHLGATAAFELLRNSARSQRRKVRSLAEEVLEGGASSLHRP